MIEHMLLYEVPIEKINLPITVMNKCLRLGVVSVGDCIDMVEREFRPSIVTHSSIIYGEITLEIIMPALVEQGYWKPEPTPNDFAPDIIAEIKQKLEEQGINWKRHTPTSKNVG